MKKRFLILLIVLTVVLSFSLISCKTEKATGQNAADVEIQRIVSHLHTSVTLYPESTSDQVNILYFNDFHGNVVEDTRERGKNIGMAKMIGYANQMKNELPNTFVVAGGDSYQGTAISNLTYGAPVSAMYKGMHVEYCAVGNHEFDWGVKHMLKWESDGGFTFLAANILYTDTQKPVEWAKPYGFVNTGKYKIAFIGLAHPDTVTLTEASKTAGLTFADPIATCQQWVNFLKSGKAEEGTPDAIIALTHIDSYQDYDSKEIKGPAVELTKVKGIDAVLSAHSHRTVAGKVNDVAILQAYKYGRSIGRLTLDFENGKLSNLNSSVVPVYKIKNDIVPEKSAYEVIKKYDDETKEITGIVLGQANGEFTHERSEANVSKLGRLVCETMVNRTGSDVAIQNGGGIRRSLYNGNITTGDAYEIMPFDNFLVTVKLKGSELKKVIDHGILNPEITDGQFYGIKVWYDPNAKFEHRVVKVELLNGDIIDDNKVYTVDVNDFMFGGGDKYDFSNNEGVVETYIPIRDNFVDYVKEHKVLTPKEVDYVFTTN